ncbi:MAG: 4-hydroxythreonine-4-phosphate dehydrogenase PdxA, partial [Polyangiaceae bacterium]|nr:4-hydroxythreonine-4-phosphate dehydrogenase PdxA [Polyangiaceae bacterium]
ERVSGAAFWLAWFLANLGHPTPKVALAGLNPHAGEGGLLGTEERDIVEPGREKAARRAELAGVKAKFLGPLGAETAFRLGAS